MEFTQWQRTALVEVLGSMAGTPAQVEQVAPLMDLLELLDDRRPREVPAPAGDHNLPITPEQAQMLLQACMVYPGWRVDARRQMRGLLVELREAAQVDPPGWAAATPAELISSWITFPISKDYRK